MTPLWTLLIIAVLIDWAACSVNVEVKLWEYSNVKGKLRNRKCCDGWFCTCEPAFHICLAYKGSERKCISQKSTKPYSKKKKITFNQRISDVKNPYVVVNIKQWRGLTVKIKVTDFDDFDIVRGEEIIGEWTYEVASAMVRSGAMTRHSGSATLEWQVSVSCTVNFHGKDCAVYCKPATRYTCNADGQKECKPDWYGEGCSKKNYCRNSNSCQNGAECKNGVNSVVCSCLPGYKGLYCDVRITTTTLATTLVTSTTARATTYTQDDTTTGSAAYTLHDATIDSVTDTDDYVTTGGATNTPYHVTTVGSTNNQNDVTRSGATYTQGDVTTGGATYVQGDITRGGSTYSQGDVTTTNTYFLQTTSDSFTTGSYGKTKNRYSSSRQNVSSTSSNAIVGVVVCLLLAVTIVVAILFARFKLRKKVIPVSAVLMSAEKAEQMLCGTWVSPRSLEAHSMAPHGTKMEIFKRSTPLVEFEPWVKQDGDCGVEVCAASLERQVTLPNVTMSDNDATGSCDGCLDITRQSTFELDCLDRMSSSGAADCSVDMRRPDESFTVTSATDSISAGQEVIDPNTMTTNSETLGDFPMVIESDTTGPSNTLTDPDNVGPVTVTTNPEPLHDVTTETESDSGDHITMATDGDPDIIPTEPNSSNCMQTALDPKLEA